MPETHSQNDSFCWCRPSGGSLSAIDILVALYANKLRFDVENPDWDDRDRFVMSKGHASPAVYSILHEVGFISEADMMSFRKWALYVRGM